MVISVKIQRKEIFGGGRRTSKEYRNNMAAYAGVITYMLSLGIRIPISRVVGDAGVGLLSPAFELFTLISLFFSYGISRTMNGLIRYRVKRGQFKSARKIFQTAIKLSALVGIALALILSVSSYHIARAVVLEPMSRWAIMAVAPAVVLMALINVFRGNFNGNGLTSLAAYSQYIEKISMFITTVVCGRMCFSYGQKVAALHHNELTAYAYGALGVVLGIILSELITILYLLIVYAIYSGTFKRQLIEDGSRRMESNGSIVAMLIGNSIPLSLIVILANSFMLIDQRFFNYCMNLSEAEQANAQIWGSYYGKFAVLIGIGAAFACLSTLGSIGKIIYSYEREEYHTMNERIEKAVRNLCIIAFPVAVNLAILAQAFVTGLYQSENEYMVSMVRRGTVIIIFYAVAYLFGQIMLKTHMMKEFLISLIISFSIHIAAILILVKGGLTGVEGVVYSVIVFMALLAVLCFCLTCRKLRYRQEWLYSVVFPAVSAALSGLVVLLISRLLLALLGGLTTILISNLVGIILYILLLMVLRVLNEAELAGLPFGRVWIVLGRMIGVL